MSVVVTSSWQTLERQRDTPTPPRGPPLLPGHIPLQVSSFEIRDDDNDVCIVWLLSGWKRDNAWKLVGAEPGHGLRNCNPDARPVTSVPVAPGPLPASASCTCVLGRLHGPASNGPFPQRPPEETPLLVHQALM